MSDMVIEKTLEVMKRAMFEMMIVHDKIVT